MEIRDYRPGRRVRTLREIRTLSIALWVGYLLAFTVALNLVHGSARSPLIFGGVAFPWVVSMTSRRRIAAFNAALQPGLASLRSGDVRRGELDFRAVEARFGWPRFLGRMAKYNLGLTLLRQGKLDEALACFVDADRRGGWVTIDGSLAASISMVHSLANRVEMAEAWLVEARQRYTLVATKHPFSSLQAEILLDLRRGRFAEVEKRLETSFSEIEYAMKGESLRPIRLLRAFSKTRSADYRGKTSAEVDLAALAPLRPGELDYLGVEWPDLAHFLEEHAGARA